MDCEIKIYYHTNNAMFLELVICQCVKLEKEANLKKFLNS